MIKRFVALFTLLCACLSFFACAGDEESFGHAELRIPLSGDFRETEAEGFDASYTNGDVLVGIMRISFLAGYNQGIPDTYMPSEFAEYYKKVTERDAVVHLEGDVAYYVYNDMPSDELYTYLACFYRSKYAYFVVLFACRAEEGAELVPELLELANKAYFVK